MEARSVEYIMFQQYGEVVSDRKDRWSNAQCIGSGYRCGSHIDSCTEDTTW